jgi:lipopolysaccharide biosynthesis glycosyltransferase
LQGVLALNQSIKDASKYPLLVLCYNVFKTTTDILDKNDVQYRVINMISSPHEAARYRGVYTKIHVFKLIEFDRVIFLDADTIMLKNVDDLFTQDIEFGATALHGVELNDKEFSPGMMVVKPSGAVYSDLMIQKDVTPTYDGGDQGFLNKFFEDKWYHIPDEYHVTKRIFKHHQDKWNAMLGNVRILHYPGSKPWSSEPRTPFEQGYEKLESIWQKVYNKVEYKPT